MPELSREDPSRPDILIFLEDPGAANFVLDFPAAFRARGLDCRLAAMGPALGFLAERAVDFLPLAGAASAVEALERLRPSLVGLGTADRPDALNLSLADHCRASGIPSIGLVDGYGNLGRRFGGASGNPLAHAPDWILTPDARSRAGYLAYGYDPGRVLDLGHPALEKVASERERLSALDRPALRSRLFPAAPGNALIIVFTAEVSRTPDPAQYRRDADYTLHGSGRFQGRTEIVLEEVLDALDALRASPGGPLPFVVLRLHPKNDPGEFTPFLGRIGQVSRGGSAHELVFAADAVIGMTTLLLLEAAYLGKPILSVVPRASEAEWLWTIGEGITPCATTRAGVAAGTAALLASAASPDRSRKAAPLPDPRGALDRYVGFFEALLRDRR
ncbi:MAG: Uncharacterized protein JWP91_1969 [Fibrobacteres bacterium]|nr:Uncharacterized protein [Fibrobacterota bacterium]